jgi:hypothetical protein
MYSLQKGRRERGRGVLRGWRGEFGGGAHPQGLVVGSPNGSTLAQRRHMCSSESANAREEDLERNLGTLEPSASKYSAVTQSLVARLVRSGTIAECFACSMQLAPRCTDLCIAFHGRVGATTADPTYRARPGYTPARWRLHKVAANNFQRFSPRENRILKRFWVVPGLPQAPSLP